VVKTDLSFTVWEKEVGAAALFAGSRSILDKLKVGFDHVTGVFECHLLESAGRSRQSRHKVRVLQSDYIF